MSHLRLVSLQLLLVLCACASSDESTPETGAGTSGADDDAADGASSSDGAETAVTDASSSGSTSGAADEAGTTGDPLAVCEADPCGGDVVGVWDYAIFLCGGPVETPSFCEGGSDWAYTTIEGTLELTADGSSILHRRDVTTFRSVLAKTCVAGGNCQAVFQDYTCTDDGTTCDCTYEVAGEWIDEVTPYSVAGTALQFEEPKGPELIDYCVAGDALALIHLEIGEWTTLTRAY
jgi:hypothetical protein